MIKVSYLVAVLMIGVQSITYAENSHYEKKKIQFSPLYVFVPDDPKFRVETKFIPGTRAILARKDGGLKVGLTSKNLPAGAYTVWMRVFNTPELCTGGEGVRGSQCSRGDDLFPPAIPTIPDSTGWSTSSVFWLAATIVGEDGIAHVSTSVETSNWPGMVLLGTDVVGTEREGVWNPMGAEVHIVIRYHGPTAAAEGPILFRDPATGLLNDITQEEKDVFFTLGRQLNRILGNCSPAFFENGNACTDLQLAVFPVH